MKNRLEKELKNEKQKGEEAQKEFDRKLERENQVLEELKETNDKNLEKQRKILEEKRLEAERLLKKQIEKVREELQQQIQKLEKEKQAKDCEIQELKDLVQQIQNTFQKDITDQKEIVDEEVALIDKLLTKNRTNDKKIKNLSDFVERNKMFVVPKLKQDIELMATKITEQDDTISVLGAEISDLKKDNQQLELDNKNLEVRSLAVKRVVEMPDDLVTLQTVLQVRDYQIHNRCVEIATLNRQIRSLGEHPCIKTRFIHINIDEYPSNQRTLTADDLEVMYILSLEAQIKNLKEGEDESTESDEINHDTDQKLPLSYVPDVLKNSNFIQQTS
jgi:hypothetical protein